MNVQALIRRTQAAATKTRTAQQAVLQRTRYQAPISAELLETLRRLDDTTHAWTEDLDAGVTYCHLNELERQALVAELATYPATARISRLRYYLETVLPRA